MTLKYRDHCPNLPPEPKTSIFLCLLDLDTQLAVETLEAPNQIHQLSSIYHFIKFLMYMTITMATTRSFVFETFYSFEPPIFSQIPISQWPSPKDSSSRISLFSSFPPPFLA